MNIMPRNSNQNDGVTANYWNTKDADTFIPSTVKAEHLPSGRYNLSKDYNDILNFTKIKDEFQEIEYNLTAQGKEILDSVELFWNSEEFFAKNNIAQRSGILLFGNVGVGKSIVVAQIIREHIKNDGVMFQAAPQEGSYDSFIEGIRTFRKIEPKRRLLCVFEEIDKIIEKTGDSQILGVLDGESSINYTMNLATTNHPDKLDPTIVNRPRRFDRIIEIGFPDKETRTSFFKGKNIEGEELELWVEKSAELSFAAMTELFVLVKAYGRDFDKSLARMKHMMVETPKLEKFRKSIGFGGK